MHRRTVLALHPQLVAVSRGCASTSAAFARAARCVCGFAFAGVLLLALALSSAAESRAAGDAQAQAQAGVVKKDQLSVRSKRDGSVQLMSGVVNTNQLDQVVVQIAGKDTKFDGELVVRIVWGDVPTSFKDGRVYFARGEFAEAAAQFRLAAGDAASRPVVKAAARLSAAQALLRWGAKEALHFAEAGEEAAKFLAEFPNNREVPEARMVQARAKWMYGQTAEAAQLNRAIFAEWKPEGPTPGYQRELCLDAGLNAARALLEMQPPDTLGARDMFASLERAAGAAAVAMEANDPAKPRMVRLQDEASLGDGFAELAGGNARQAVSFFQSKLANKSSMSDTLRCAASFGLAQALLAEGKLREALFQFAYVSAMEHRDRDRAAAAQVGLADTTLKLADPDATPQARAWLESVTQTQGDTLASVRARELLKKL
jgi:hypothetical protein